MKLARQSLDTRDKVVFLSKEKLSNRSLIRGLSEGDNCAAIQFHERYTERISRLVWRLLGTDTEHDDVVQQVFVNILSSSGDINKPESLDSWVDSVVIRTVRYEIRKRVKRRTRFFWPDKTDIDTYRDTRSPFSGLHIRRFYAILDAMPTDDRIIFVLKHLEEYRYQEIAEFLNCSLTTVKRRIRRATVLFRKKAIRDNVLICLFEETDAV